MSHPAVPNRRRKTWIAPLISTIVTPPLAFFAFALTVFSAMACDACSAAENHSFAASINPAWIVFRCGQVLALLAIVVSWVFVRNRPAAAILLALAAPVTVLLSLGIFMTVVDWP